MSNLAAGFIVQAFGYPAGFLTLDAIALAALVFFALLILKRDRTRHRMGTLQLHPQLSPRPKK